MTKKKKRTGETKKQLAQQNRIETQSAMMAKTTAKQITFASLRRADTDATSDGLALWQNVYY